MTWRPCAGSERGRAAAKTGANLKGLKGLFAHVLLGPNAIALGANSIRFPLLSSITSQAACIPGLCGRWFFISTCPRSDHEGQKGASGWAQSAGGPHALLEICNSHKRPRPPQGRTYCTGEQTLANRLWASSLTRLERGVAGLVCANFRPALCPLFQEKK